SARQAAITAIPRAAIRNAIGLCLPVRDATLEGSPKMPLPTMMLTISAARLQRPIARTAFVVPDRDTEFLYVTRYSRRTASCAAAPITTMPYYHPKTSTSGLIGCSSLIQLILASVSCSASNFRRGDSRDPISDHESLELPSFPT